jgi:hypothetical protein
MFVLFRRLTNQSSAQVPLPSERRLGDLRGPWQVHFQADRGAPVAATFPTLSDFRNNADPGIRFFSGVATYAKELVLPRLAPGEKLWLDLGEVHDLAEIWIDGKLAGTTWKPPYRVDITAQAKAGTHRLEIRAVNTWVNRLIGDAQPGVTHKITFTSADGKIPAGMDPAAYARRLQMPYPADAPLKPGGLIGPVVLVRESKPQASGIR